MSESAARKEETVTQCSNCAVMLARPVSYCPYCGKSAPNVIPFRLKAAIAAGGRPFTFEGQNYVSLHDLMEAYAKNWDAGVNATERGYVIDWARGDLRDFVAAGFLQDLRENPSLTPDECLFAAIARFCPELPPCWKGRRLDRDALFALANEDDPSALLSEVFSLHLLSRFDEIARTEMCAPLARDWSAVAADFREQWSMLMAGGGPADKFGGDAWLASRALRILLVPSFVADLEEQRKACSAGGAGDCDWYAQLGETPGALLAVSLVRTDAVEAGEQARAARDRAERAKSNTALWAPRRRVLVLASAANGLLIGSIMGLIRWQWQVQFAVLPSGWDILGNTEAEFFTLPLAYVFGFLALLCAGAALAGSTYAYYRYLRGQLEESP